MQSSSSIKIDDKGRKRQEGEGDRAGALEWCARYWTASLFIYCWHFVTKRDAIRLWYSLPQTWIRLSVCAKPVPVPSCKPLPGDMRVAEYVTEENNCLQYETPLWLPNVGREMFKNRKELRRHGLKIPIFSSKYHLNRQPLLSLPLRKPYCLRTGLLLINRTVPAGRQLFPVHLVNRKGFCFSFGSMESLALDDLFTWMGNWMRDCSLAFFIA